MAAALAAYHANAPRDRKPLRASKSAHLGVSRHPRPPLTIVAGNPHPPATPGKKDKPLVEAEFFGYVRVGGRGVG